MALWRVAADAMAPFSASTIQLAYETGGRMMAADLEKTPDIYPLLLAYRDRRDSYLRVFIDAVRSVALACIELTVPVSRQGHRGRAR